MRRLFSLLAAGALIAAFVSGAAAGPARSGRHSNVRRLGASGRHGPLTHWCNTNGITCAEPFDNWEDFDAVEQAQKRGVQIADYIGHDEPSLIYYSDTPGSGNNNTYLIRLPKDPPVKPRQDGSGGTWNFQLRPAFWLGMVMCDDQSSPNPPWSGAAYPNVPCQPDSDANIKMDTDPNSPDYMGIHPGAAFMEMQFYPPGWAPWPAGVSCTAHEWCAALNIDSLSIDFNTGAVNNDDCLNTAGIEPVNFAFITKDGNATTPANPVNPDRLVPDLSKDLLMRPGDQLRVHLFDTAEGFRVTIRDLTAHTRGSMTASVDNGFAQVVFDPDATTCQTTAAAFHPAYSTAAPDTTTVWGAHTYNVSYSDEIGHFEYCSRVNEDDVGSCAEPGGFDTNNPDVATDEELGDDEFCLPAELSTLVKVGGCLDTDGDFDGSSYDHAWPGSISNHRVDALMNPQPMLFTSPTFNGGENYDRIAFEADLPRIEADDTVFDGVHTPCQRHIANPADPSPGTGCVLPPPQSRFYPFYSTTRYAGRCWWQEGGPYIPGTRRTFGGVTQYGALLESAYPTDPPGTVSTRYNNFHKTLPRNPCNK